MTMLRSEKNYLVVHGADGLAFYAPPSAGDIGMARDDPELLSFQPSHGLEFTLPRSAWESFCVDSRIVEAGELRTGPVSIGVPDGGPTEKYLLEHGFSRITSSGSPRPS